MKKKEITLHWDEYEAGDLIVSTNSLSRLEEGTVYEVLRFTPPPFSREETDCSYGWVDLEDEDGAYRLVRTDYIRPANWWIEVKMDETDQWSEGSEIRDFLGEEDGRVYCVYFYNEMEHTHLCEITPSYYGVFAYSYTTVPLPANLQDDFDDVTNMVSCDNYFHARHIDAIAGKYRCELGIFGNLGDTPQEIEDEVLEYVRGSPNWG